MLKGWFDRIWAPGIAFKLGDGAIEPLLTNIKRIGVVTTYGSPLWLLWVIGWPDKKLINRGLRRLCARDCRVEWLMLTRMDQRTAPERTAFLAKVKARLSRW
jgi:putative NADPH-quinone reductase